MIISYLLLLSPRPRRGQTLETEARTLEAKATIQYDNIILIIIVASAPTRPDPRSRGHYPRGRSHKILASRGLEVEARPRGLTSLVATLKVDDETLVLALVQLGVVENLLDDLLELVALHFHRVEVELSQAAIGHLVEGEEGRGELHHQVIHLLQRDEMNIRVRSFGQIVQFTIAYCFL